MGLLLDKILFYDNVEQLYAVEMWYVQQIFRVFPKEE